MSSFIVPLLVINVFNALLADQVQRIEQRVDSLGITYMMVAGKRRVCDVCHACDYFIHAYTLL
jgi:hypothetical protein